MKSFSLFELEALAPRDFRRWATWGVFLGAVAYTGVATMLVLLQTAATLISPWTSAVAAVVCWIALAIVLSGRARLGAALAAIACVLEVHIAFATTPVFPSVGLVAVPVLVIAVSLTFGATAGLGFTLASIVSTPLLLRQSPAFASGAFGVGSAYWLAVQALVTFATWGLVAISLSTLRRVVELARAREQEVEALMRREVEERERAAAAQRDTQEQQAHSQRLEAIGQLAGGIAHDFNNLLMAISGSAELARDEADAEMRATLLDEVLAAQERGASLTRQLLAFARRDVAHPTVLDLSALVAQRQRLLQPIVGDRVQLVLDLEPDCRVRIDAAQIEQALVNLVANARDAMPGGGRCVITVRREATSGGPGQVRLRIEDEGMGMDAETAARAFEPFFTTKSRGHGTGLGLAAVQGIILQSGGTVTIESAVGKGTAILIVLPLVDAPLDEHPFSPLPREPRARGGSTILVVDDDDSTRTVVARILQRAGHRVLLAPDGLQAIRTIMADGESIDMLVSDVTMPGLTGPELAEAVQSRIPGLPMLFISGYPKDVVTAEGGLRPEDDLLTKPFTARELTDRVADRLAAARAARV